MQVKALDTIRVSSAGGRKEQGQVFEVSDYEGKELLARGLVVAVTIGEVAASPQGKAAPKPRRKAK